MIILRCDDCDMQTLIEARDYGYADTTLVDNPTGWTKRGPNEHSCPRCSRRRFEKTGESR